MLPFEYFESFYLHLKVLFVSSKAPVYANIRNLSTNNVLTKYTDTYKYKPFIVS